MAYKDTEKKAGQNEIKQGVNSTFFGWYLLYHHLTNNPSNVAWGPKRFARVRIVKCPHAPLKCSRMTSCVTQYSLRIASGGINDAMNKIEKRRCDKYFSLKADQKNYTIRKIKERELPESNGLTLFHWYKGCS